MGEAKPYRQVEESTLRHLEKLLFEIVAVHERVVLPEFGSKSGLHGMGRTAYGYVMNCFAFIDLLSRFRTGGEQTKRMASFLVDYLGYSDEASRVVVQTWRHNLMHTGSPGLVQGQRSKTRYKYLLQWGSEHLPRDHHMDFQSAGSDPRILNLGVKFLAEDLLSGAGRFFADVRESAELQKRVVAINQKIEAPAPFRD